MTIGHCIFGQGRERVLIMHDWFCDTSSYDAMRPYLDPKTFTYAFMDLRGYGKSKSIQGECTAEEAAQDAIALADSLKWDQFHVVGHSMTGMVAQLIAVMAPDRVKSVTAITPVPACGSPAPEEVMGFLEDAAATNDESAQQIVGFMTGGRHTKPFIDHKVSRWRETSVSQARVAYLHMFTQTDFSDKAKGLQTPFLVLVGAHDAEGHSAAVMEQTFCQYYPNVDLVTIQNAGHYPMQETPVFLAGTMETFMKKYS